MSDRSLLLMYLTPDDLFFLESLAIERLQEEFPPLGLCEIHMTANQVLVIECWEPELLDIVQDFIRFLEYRAWEVAGALEIIGTLDGFYEFQTKTRRRTAELGRNSLRFSE